MKKVLAIIGSPRKAETYDAVTLFKEQLETRGDVDFEFMHLAEKNIHQCSGCLRCCLEGEEYCRFSDDSQEIFKKMSEADGVIFATPVYAFQVSAQLKILIDRLAFVFHRPCFFGKAFIAVAVQAVYGYKGVLKYLNNIAHFWGFSTVPGLGLETPPGFRPPRLKAANDLKMKKSVDDFYALLSGNRLKTPGFADLMMFRSTRSARPYLKAMPRDYEYFKGKGWMNSDYYYPVKLGPVKKLAGKYFDRQGRKYGERLMKESMENS